MPEMIPLLKINDRDLRQQILTHVYEHAHRHRGKMMEVADSVESMGASQCMQIILPLVQDEPASASLTGQVGSADHILVMQMVLMHHMLQEVDPIGGHYLVIAAQPLHTSLIALVPTKQCQLISRHLDEQC